MYLKNLLQTKRIEIAKLVHTSQLSGYPDENCMLTNEYLKRGGNSRFPHNKWLSKCT
jgi:hypothetical protein